MARFLPRDPEIQADPVARAAPDRADPATPAERRADTMAQADPRRADPADPRVGTVARVGPADPAARVDLREHLADPVALVTRVDLREHLAGHGMGMRIVATSTKPRGATDPHRGGLANRHGPTGAGHSLLPVGDG
jgi:hypothetical protein